MSPPEDHPLSGLPPVVVPASLLATVERAGSRALRPTPARPASLRQRLVDVAMTGFCVGNVIWMARIVHLLP